MRKFNRLWIVLILATFVLDRFLKYLALTGHAARFLPGFLTFELFKNDGIAFSLPLSGPLVWLLSLAILAGVCLMAVKDFKRRHYARAEAYGLFLFGACSNLFDRIAYGFTADYLIILSRSAINIADTMIVIGAVWLLLGAPDRRR